MDKTQKHAFLAVLADKGRCRVKVEGGSMTPFIKNKDTVEIVRKKQLPGYGSVIAFFIEHQLIVHRVRKMQRICGGWYFYTCGDSTPGSLCRVAQSEIAGEVSRVIRGKKELNAWFVPPLRYVALPAGVPYRFLCRFARLACSGFQRIRQTGRLFGN